MFREMRRKKQELSQEESIAILYNRTSGVLAVSGDDDYPYAVPLSYVYDGEKLYFHCAKSGHKLDAIKKNAKASFCIIEQDQVVPEKYTTFFKSVIAFGTIRILAEEQEIRTAIGKLALKYDPDDTANRRENAINDDISSLCMLEMTIQHMTGKQCTELVAKN